MWRGAPVNAVVAGSKTAAAHAYIVRLEYGSVRVYIITHKRLRRWKEQILHRISVLDSNRHNDQLVTRAETAAIAESGQKILRERGDLRDLVEKHAECAWLEETPGPNQKYAEYVEFLQSLDHPNEASREYLAVHFHRIARTLALAPPLQTGRALELGAYMYMTPALGCVLGYREVRGAY
jgi:hypothetical protein